MAKIIGEFKGVVEKRFCTRCNREVYQNETEIEQTIVIGSGYTLRIDEQFMHDECGGIIQTLLMNYLDH